MLVHGVIVPPRAALEAVDAVVRSVPVPGGAVEAAASRAGLLGRIGRHRAESAVPTVMLEHVQVDDMHLPITGFGNLTTTDAHRILDAIKDAASGWPVPTVRLAGGTALDFPGDWSVWAKLDGDLDALATVGRGVPQSVERLGFFVDRRMFRPMLSVATVTPQTTGPFLQEVVDALEAFRGEEWPVEISLLKEGFVDGRTVRTEFERIRPGG
jgi:2'-5' RNA ligase